MKQPFGSKPDFLGIFKDINLTEVMYYLYLPVSMWGSDIRIPHNCLPALPLIKAALNYAYSHDRNYKFAYLSARKGWATADNPLNRPGWHCDGFGTNDLNFVWWDGPGTRFACQDFASISADHKQSLAQFEAQIDPLKVQTPEEHGFYVIDPYVVHATPVITTPCMRQYIKISLSNEQYNLENNSHNYMFKYDWSMLRRENVRNDTFKAQADYA